MVWDKTNDKGNEKRTFNGRQILKGWMPKFEEVDGSRTGNVFNGNTGKYEDPPNMRGGGEGESKGGDDEL